METREELNGPASGAPLPGEEGCAHCGEPFSSIPPVVSTSLGVKIRRCHRCGSRATVEPPARFVANCDVCCAAYLEERPTEASAHECPACAAGQGPERPESTVSEASQAEIREALDATCSFVEGQVLQEYIDGLVRCLADRIPGVPRDCRVVLLDHPSLVTLGLPSGEILLSLGMLRFLDDEAELAFVIAHELAHLASDAPGERLCQVGFDTVGRDESGELQQAWTRAAFEQARLGYGSNRERRADEQALAALRASGYDPRSALRLLERFRDRIEGGDESLAELAAAHPPASDRMRRLDSQLAGQVAVDRIERVNREVFRRAVSAGLAPEALHPVRLEREIAPRSSGVAPVWPKVLTGGVVTAALLLLIWWLIRLIAA